MVEAGASERGIVMCNYPLMAANPRIALGEDVPAAATTDSWMSRGLLPPRVEDDNIKPWEERVFAEDTGGLIAGTWPPRSYSCDFCKRDFRSAQALGGHMNVHRRDRARLRQSSSTHLGPPNHQRWSSPSPASQEIPGHYQFPAFNSHFVENSILHPVTPNPSIISSSSIMPAPPLVINSHVTYYPIQRLRGHEISPSKVHPVSPYTPYGHAFPTISSSPPVSNSLTMTIPNNHHQVSDFDRHHGGFASSMAESAEVLRKLQQTRAFQPCFPVSSLRKQNISAIEHEIRINNSKNEEAISLDKDHESVDDGLDLELRLGQTKF